MLNISFLASTKVELEPDSLHCGIWAKCLKAYIDLDPDLTIPNIELVRAIFIYDIAVKFHVHISINF